MDEEWELRLQLMDGSSLFRRQPPRLSAAADVNVIYINIGARGKGERCDSSRPGASRTPADRRVGAASLLMPGNGMDRICPHKLAIETYGLRSSVY